MIGKIKPLQQEMDASFRDGSLSPQTQFVNFARHYHVRLRGALAVLHRFYVHILKIVEVP